MTNDTPTLPSQFQWNFCPLGGDAVPIFDFKLRLNCSPGGDPRSSSFVEYPLSIDFRQDFTLLAWAFCEDRSQWRSILSFESPQVSTSLLSLALPPRSEPNVIHLAYMTSMQASHLKGLQGALEVPFPNLWFHVAVVFKTGTFGSDTFTIYVNGVEDATLIVDQGIFRAKDINIVLGSRKFMNGPASQWSGSIENVRVHQAAITEEQINAHLAEGSLPRIRALRTSTCQWPAIDPVTSPLGDARLSDHDGDAEQPWMS
ncbi:hypothetical protein BV22DRAFT_410168 [Leucogyrophana mollusca]|uniref:Uncharacterized protein n=1 Tax=Leucogyrophana mollusca TaxID=85980 RepID=A0ACB8BK38_9AGAM|nr:hypothetical protein BV22DRAFT_410168 [Leucogyrophana mollusca]